VVFDFVVELAAGREPDPAWSEDGLTWTIAEPPEAAEPPAGAPGEDAAEPAPAAAARPGATGGSVVRVELARVDAVMRLVGDLVTTRSRLEDLLRRPGGAETSAGRDALEETSAAMERQLRQLREGVMRLRLVPVGEVFERLRFAARDAIRESGKRVSLAFRGETSEIDKLVVDRMLEPLLHLVRNAVSHGIESADERLALDKPAEGTLTLRASAAGDRIVIEVEDDGRGIDATRVAERGGEGGLLLPDDELAADQILDVLCTPGFSTREEADMTSGRGVGMDVVASAVRALAGRLSMTTVSGRGTRFVIELPLTLMILDALLVEIGGQQMAMPQPALREILQIERSAIIAFENNEVVSYRGGVLPLVDLASLFALPPGGRETAYLLVVGSEDSPMGLLVDRLVELREIVVHPVTDPLVTVPGVAGATDLGDGRVSLILDAAALVRLAHERRDQRTRSRAHSRSGAMPLVRGPRASHLSA
jgi:two-component system chemotaxis sensor kinase CheA